jgi:hypothetical protein
MYLQQAEERGGSTAGGGEKRIGCMLRRGEDRLQVEERRGSAAGGGEGGGKDIK